MIDAFRKLFTAAPDTPALSGPDEKLALAALLVDAARRDDDYQDAEKAAIDRILAVENEIDITEAKALRLEAEKAQGDAVGLFRFTQALKDATPFEDRITIVEHLWDVALADADRDAAEDNLVRQVCGLLGVSDRDSGLARQRVEARMSS